MNESMLADDARSTIELVNLILISNDEDSADSTYWDAVWTLRRRGTVEVFESARSLCAGQCPLEQRVGCDILAQLGAPKMPFVAASFPIVVSVVTNPRNLDTLASSLSALGWLRDLRGVDYVLPYLNHSDSDIRFFVTHALTALHDDQRSIEGLTHLTTDSSTKVRDWATFGLGSIIETDTSAIRQALHSRLRDRDDIVRGEALVGLAKRQDARVIEALVKELELAQFHHTVNEFAVEALDALRDCDKYPQLAKWRIHD